MTRMKDSGIEWIGQIPEEWEVIKTKYFTYMKGRIGWQGLKADEFKDSGPYLVTGTDFFNGRVNWENAYHISERRYDEAPEIQLRVGDLLVTKDGTVGKLALIDKLPDKASLNSHLLVLRPQNNRFINKFFYYVLSSIVFRNYFSLVSIGSTMDSLSQEKMEAFIFTVPSLAEQEKISDFLDKKVAQLDKTKSLLEEQIKKLEAYRQSLIYETVTKGLDKTAPMKDSGVDWIGQVPEGWGVKPLKYIITFQNGYAFDSNDLTDEDTGINVIRIGDFKPSGIDFESALKYSGNGIDKLEQYKIKDGQILLAMSGATVGKISYVQNVSNNISYINQRVGIIESIFNKFIYFILSTSSFIEFIMLNSNGSAQPNISSNQVGEFQIPLPSYFEIVQIADFLDKKVSQINQLIAIKQKQIANINQQRQTLIYDYVTGKRRV